MVSEKPATTDETDDGDRIATVNSTSEDTMPAEQNAVEFNGDGALENSDILIINHDDENKENISLEDADAESDINGTELNDLNDQETANPAESFADNNADDIQSANDETKDTIDSERGVDVNEYGDTGIDLADKETVNIEDISPPSMHGSAVSRISVHSAQIEMLNSTPVTPNSGKKGTPPPDVRSASAYSQIDDQSMRPISSEQTPRQASGDSRMSRRSINGTVGSANGRKSAGSVRISAPPTPRSTHDNKSITSGNAKSRPETGLALAPQEADVDFSENSKVYQTADAAGSNDEMGIEKSAEDNDNPPEKNSNDFESDVLPEAQLADDTKTAEEVNLFSLANFYCVAKRVHIIGNQWDVRLLKYFAFHSYHPLDSLHKSQPQYIAK